MIRLVVLACVLAACSSKSGPSCAEQALELDRLLSNVDHDPSPLDLTGAHAVTRDDLPKVASEFASTLRVSPREVVLDGQKLSFEQLEDRLDAQRGRGLIYLVFDEAVPWDRVAFVAQLTADAGVTSPAFVFARTAGTKQVPPPRVPIDDELDKIQNSDDAGTKATKLAELIKGLIKSCPALTEAFGKVATTESEDKAGYIIRSIQPALLDCNCKVDIPAFRSVMWRMLASTSPASALRVTLDRSAPPIALPATTPWKDASKQLKPDTTRAWLTVK